MIQIDVTGDSFADAFEAALKGVRTGKIMARQEFAILQRTARGEFLDGSSANAGAYSTKPFARPAGGLLDSVREKLVQDTASYFTTNGGATWLLIKGGYRSVRQAKGLPVGTVDLRDDGTMLDGLRSRATATGDGVQMEVGYIDGMSPQEATEIARYHNVLGAGKNKTKRVFIGITDEEADAIVDDVAEDLGRTI